MRPPQRAERLHRGLGAQARIAKGADATARRLREIYIMQGKRVHPIPLGRTGIVSKGR